VGKKGENLSWVGGKYRNHVHFRHRAKGEKGMLSGVLGLKAPGRKKSRQWWKENRVSRLGPQQEEFSKNQEEKPEKPEKPCRNDGGEGLCLRYKGVAKGGTFGSRRKPEAEATVKGGIWQDGA